MTKAGSVSFRNGVFRWNGCSGLISKSGGTTERMGETVRLAALLIQGRRKGKVEPGCVQRRFIYRKQNSSGGWRRLGVKEMDLGLL